MGDWEGNSSCNGSIRETGGEIWADDQQEDSTYGPGSGKGGAWYTLASGRSSPDYQRFATRKQVQDLFSIVVQLIFAARTQLNL